MQSLELRRRFIFSSLNKENSMETLIGLLLVGAAAWWFFRAGKSIGSRKGYGVGRSRSRRK
jgi:hypothetical protein